MQNGSKRRVAAEYIPLRRLREGRQPYVDGAKLYRIAVFTKERDSPQQVVRFPHQVDVLEMYVLRMVLLQHARHIPRVVE